MLDYYLSCSLSAVLSDAREHIAFYEVRVALYKKMDGRNGNPNWRESVEKELNAYVQLSPHVAGIKKRISSSKTTRPWTICRRKSSDNERAHARRVAINPRPPAHRPDWRSSLSVSVWAEDGHTLAGAGSGYPAPPLLAARAGTGLIHLRPGSAAAECRSPAPASEPQPMLGPCTGSSTRDLGPPVFQWLPPVPGRPARFTGPVPAVLAAGWAGRNQIIKIYSTQSPILAAPVCH